MMHAGSAKTDEAGDAPGLMRPWSVPVLQGGLCALMVQNDGSADLQAGSLPGAAATLASFERHLTRHAHEVPQACSTIAASACVAG